MNKKVQKSTGQTALPGFVAVALASHLLIGAANAQTLTTIKSFGIPTNVTRLSPKSPLIQGSDGTLYGTAFDSEGLIRGTVFKIQPDGSGFAFN